MDVLIVVDMQVGLRSGAPKHDLQGVIERINRLADMVRNQAGKVIWIQHSADAGEFAPGSPTWPLLPELQRQPSDVVIRKTLNDAFVGTDLETTLQRLAPDRVLICGWATDFCVDTTLRSAVSRDFNIVAVGDAHTLADRPHLDAAGVIRHHNWVWSNLISNGSIRVMTATELLAS